VEGAGGVTGRLLTARELADQLGVTAETVLRWTRRGELPAFKLPGGAIRYREDDLDAWLERRATGAADREGESQPDGRAHVGGYAPLRLQVRANPPPEAATTEEEPDAPSPTRPRP
jgi:excisionase family DNA binding protein